MPFDSYSPLTPGVRGIGVGGNQVLSDGSYYGCCACIGSVGLGLYASHRLLRSENGLTLSLFDEGESEIEINGNPITIAVKGHYPRCGDIKITVTQISAGTQHNIVPDECRFVVDVRTTDAYTNEEVVELLQSALECDAKPRSTRVRASAISLSHPLVESAVAIGRTPFISPTTSDRAIMQGLPALKMGVGESSRSHTADEFVLVNEIEEGLALYQKLLN